MIEIDPTLRELREIGLIIKEMTDPIAAEVLSANTAGIVTSRRSTVFELDVSGLCAQEDAEVFFPPPDDPAAELEAKRICIRCPLLEECISVSLTRNIGDDGVRACMTDRERLNARRRGRKVLSSEVDQSEAA